MGISRRKQTTLSCLMLFSILSVSEPRDPSNEPNIGLILDMRSRLGKTVHLCIELAISDFYLVNSAYKTRINLHSRDSKGEASRVLSAVHDLLSTTKVQAIIIPEAPLEGRLLALFSEKAKIPFFSFTWSPSSVQYPYLFQIKEDDTFTFEGIAALVESFKWRNAIILYEDTSYKRETILHLVKCFQEKNIAIFYSIAILPSASDDQILQQLDNVTTARMTAVIVHMSTSLAARFLLIAKKLSMLSEKCTWIITDKAMDLLHAMESEAIESVEGVLALKPYIPASHKLQNFTTRWKMEYLRKYPDIEAREMSVLGVWAYDAIWALAGCVEQLRNKTTFIDWKQDIGISMNGAILVNEMSKVRFEGLSGEFQLVNGKLVPMALEIVKISGSEEKRLGFWTLGDGFKNDIKATRRLEDFTTNLGKKLIVGVPVNSTFKELVNIDYDLDTNAINITGFCIEVFRAAIGALPYELPCEFVPFAEPNGESSGTYEELLHQVSLQKFDCAMGDITILGNRSKWVDFTLSYTDIGVGTIARIDHKDMWIFVRPFGVVVWLTTAASFILMGVVLWLFEHPVNEVFQGTLAQQIGTMLSFIFMTLFFAQREPLKSNWSRFVVIIWLFVVLILISCYTAILSSLLTVQQIQLASKGNIIGYPDSSFVQGVIANNMNFSDYRLKPYRSPQEYAEDLSRGSKHGGVAAIIDEIPYLKIFLGQYPAGYGMVASESITNGFGFAFQKGSPLVQDVSREISKLREKGTLEMLEKKWFKCSSYLTSEHSAGAPKILNFGDLSVPFAFVAAAFGLAFLGYLNNFFRERFHLSRYIFIILGREIGNHDEVHYPRNFNGQAIT